jgi:hypothetical protein
MNRSPFSILALAAAAALPGCEDAARPLRPSPMMSVAATERRRWCRA